MLAELALSNAAEAMIEGPPPWNAKRFAAFALS